MNVPQCLMPFAYERRWVLWRWQERDGKQTKPPFQPSGAYASATDAATWSTLAEVQAVAGGFDGIGINMLGLEGIGGIDLDGMRDPATGEPTSKAAADLLTCGAYVEVSPSGTGYRIFGKTNRTKGSQHKEQGVGFEVYGSDDARYLTITGQRVADAPDALNDITPAIEWLERSAQARQQQAPPADRSGRFYATVGRLKNAGLTLDAAEAALRADPVNSGADKYLEPKDRLRVELQRAWGKLDGPPRQRGFALDQIGAIELNAPVYLIDGLIEVSSLGLLFGDPGVGKSFVALDWALSVAAGEDTLGREVKQGSVIYIAGEGHTGLVRRCHAWAMHHKRDLKEVPLLLSRGPADLAKVVAEVKEAIDASGKSPRLIVVDTVARNFGDGDENSTKDMTAFIAAVDDLKAAYPDCVVLLVHHTGHSEKQRARGSMALKGALDFEYRLDDQGGKLVLTNTKMKDGPQPDKIIMELRQVDLGDETTSAVVVQGAASAVGGPRLNEQQQQGLDALISVAREHGTPGSGGCLWVATEAWRLAFYEALGPSVKRDTKLKAFNRVRDALAARGSITIERDGVRLDHATSLRSSNRGVVV